MSTPRNHRRDGSDASSFLRPPTTPSRTNSSFDHDAPTPSHATNPTYAIFSPTTNPAASAAKRRSTILVHQKSPLLLATPPQITRALAYSHPFLLPLNKLAGLLSWTTNDPWESFLVVAAWWGIVLYGDVAVRVAGPVIVVLCLIAGMYGRRYSPLSSSGWRDADTQGIHNHAPAKGHRKQKSSLAVDGAAASAAATPSAQLQREDEEATSTRHQKTLDEIVDTLREFTARCNILLEPLLELTDFLSTQRTPTSATTRPALTALFVRILLCTPGWYVLGLRPWRIVTARRVMLVVGTVALTWHSRVMRVGRTILWRSGMVRRACAVITGLSFEGPMRPGDGSTSGSIAVPGKEGAKAELPYGIAKAQESELTKAIRRARGGLDSGVRFTFIIYENQRRWLGLGWTPSLFAYERPAWTDEHNNAVPPKDSFELPDVEDGSRMRWRWVEGSRWRVDGVADEAVGEGEDYDGEAGKMGWVFYDNKWQYGRRGQDGWNRWTRRRKWYRDAELVETEAGEEGPSKREAHSPTPPSLPPRPITPVPAHSRNTSAADSTAFASPSGATSTTAVNEDDRVEEDDAVSMLSTSSRSGRFKAPSLRRRVTAGSTVSASGRPRRASLAASEDDAASLDSRTNIAIQGQGQNWGVGDEVRMGLE